MKRFPRLESGCVCLPDCHRVLGIRAAGPASCRLGACVASRTRGTASAQSPAGTQSQQRTLKCSGMGVGGWLGEGQERLAREEQGW